jgi:hypothetical protein
VKDCAADPHSGPSANDDRLIEPHAKSRVPDSSFRNLNGDAPLRPCRCECRATDAVLHEEFLERGHQSDPTIMACEGAAGMIMSLSPLRWCRLAELWGVPPTWLLGNCVVQMPRIGLLIHRSGGNSSLGGTLLSTRGWLSSSGKTPVSKVRLQGTG